MKKGLVRIIVSISFIFTLPLLSCVTLGTPSLPKPHGDSDTLLIVPFGRAADSNTGSYGNLRITYVTLPSTHSESAEEVFFVTGPKARSTKLYAKYPMFGTVRYLRPGSYEIEAVRFVSEEHEYRGKRNNLQNIEFTLEPKAITVLPYRFIVNYTKPIKQYKSEGFYIFILATDVTDIQIMSEGEIDLLWEELGSYNNVELWEKM